MTVISDAYNKNWFLCTYSRVRKKNPALGAGLTSPGVELLLGETQQGAASSGFGCAERVLGHHHGSSSSTKRVLRHLQGGGIPWRLRLPLVGSRVQTLVALAALASRALVALAAATGLPAPVALAALP